MNHWKRNFFTIWTGQALSQLTSSILQFAIVWYLTDHTGSALVLSAAMFIGFLPQGLLGPFIGVFIDRYDRKTIMVLSDLGIALASLVLVVAGMGGVISTELILLVLFLRSIGSAFHNPCLQAVTPQIVPQDQLTRCAGYSQTLESVSTLLSPVIAAVLYQSWKLSGIIFLDVLGALAAIATLWKSHIPAREKPEEKVELHVLRGIREGFQILRGNKGILGLMLIGALYTLAMMPTSALFPLMSMSYFGGSSTQASIVEVTFSIGLLIGSIALSVWGGPKNKMLSIIGSYLLMSASLVGSGLLSPDGFWMFAVFSCLMGLSNPFYWGMVTPLIQSSFEHQYLGRVLSLSKSMQLICGPIGLSFSGVLAELFGVNRWFLIAGCIMLIAAGLCAGIPSVRTCAQQPE